MSEERIPLSSLRPLPAELEGKALIQLACLTGLKPTVGAKWSPEATDKLQAILGGAEKVFMIRKVIRIYVPFH